MPQNGDRVGATGMEDAALRGRHAISRGGISQSGVRYWHDIRREPISEPFAKINEPLFPSRPRKIQSGLLRKRAIPGDAATDSIEKAHVHCGIDTSEISQHRVGSKPAKQPPEKNRVAQTSWLRGGPREHRTTFPSADDIFAPAINEQTNAMPRTREEFRERPVLLAQRIVRSTRANEKSELHAVVSRVNSECALASSLTTNRVPNGAERFVWNRPAGVRFLHLLNWAKTMAKVSNYCFRSRFLLQHLNRSIGTHIFFEYRC